MSEGYAYVFGCLLNFKIFAKAQITMEANSIIKTNVLKLEL